MKLGPDSVNLNCCTEHINNYNLNKPKATLSYIKQ